MKLIIDALNHKTYQELLISIFHITIIFHIWTDSFTTKDMNESMMTYDVTWIFVINFSLLII